MYTPRNAFIFLVAVLHFCSIESHAQSSTPIPLGSSLNIYSTILPDQNQLSYEPALNAVTFIHRPDAGSPSDSFGLVFNRSLDGGATWSSQIDLTPSFLGGGTPPIAGNRYPSATIYNPPGNTDPALAFAVASCPVLYEDSIWKRWGYIGHHSGRLTDGTSNCEEYITDNPARPELLHPYSLITNSTGEMWSISSSLDTAGSAPHYEVLHINKGVWNSSTECADWSIVDSIVPDFVLGSSAYYPVYYPSRAIAFGPSGMVGYIAFSGAETTSAYCNKQPIVHKTIDGGATWNRLPDFDFRTLPIFNYSLPASTCPGHTPTFDFIDITVDATDRFHLLAEVLARPDCPCTVFTTTEGEPDLVTLITSDGISWTGNMIDSTITNYGLAGSLEHRAAPTIARTADGKKIFYSWAKTDPDSSGNSWPDVWIRGYDIDSSTFTDPLNLTAGTPIQGKSFFPTMAPIAMQAGSAKDYELAIICSELDTLPFLSEDLNPPTYYFLGGAGLDSVDFRVGSVDTTGSDSTATGLLQSALASNALEISPNPVRQGSFIVNVQFDHFAEGYLRLNDVAGRVVFEKPIALKQGSNQLTVAIPDELASGLYIVGIQTQTVLLSGSVLIE